MGSTVEPQVFMGDNNLILVPTKFADFSLFQGENSMFEIYHRACDGVIVFVPNDVDPDLARYRCHGEKDDGTPACGVFWYHKDLLKMHPTRISTIFETLFEVNPADAWPFKLCTGNNGVNSYTYTQEMSDGERLNYYLAEIDYVRNKKGITK